MATIAVLGTLDTKGREHEFVAERIRARGHTTLLIDVGTGAEPAVTPDIPRAEVAAAAGIDLAALVARRDRGECVTAMTTAAPRLLQRLIAEGRIQGVISLGGGGGTAIASAAMRPLPIGFPKLIVSTLASGNTAHYMGTTDITMMPAVVDVQGLNRISRTIFARAAAAICGMVEADVSPTDDKPLIVASMFGNTTKCIEAAVPLLEQAGYEVVVFAATGTGGRAMEALIASGLVAGVLDITTTELADERGRPRAARCRGEARRAGDRRPWLSRHGEFRRTAHGARSVRRPHALRPQPAGHAHADDAGRVCDAGHAPDHEGERLARPRDHAPSAPGHQRDQRGRRPLS
jgi:uncharacterized protein (UPF0261 family)